MRRYQKYLLVITGAVLFAYAGAAGTAVYGQTDGRLAGQAVDGINGKEETGPGIGLKDINTEESAKEQELMGNIPAASETDSLILVVGQGEAVEPSVSFTSNVIPAASCTTRVIVPVTFAL